MPTVDPPNAFRRLIPAPLRPWALTIGLCIAALAAYAIFAMMGLAATSDPILGALIANVSVFGAIWYFRCHQSFVQLTQATVPRRIDMTGLQFWAVFTGGILLCWLGGQIIAGWIYTQLGSQGFDAVQDTKMQSHVALLLLLSLIAAPLGEEALLRGVAYPMLRRHWPPLAAGFVTAAIFGILHGNIVQFILTVPFGIFLAFVYEHTQRLPEVVGAHIAFNVLSTVAPVSWVSQMTSGYTAVVFAIAIVGLLIIMHPVHDVPDKASPIVR